MFVFTLFLCCLVFFAGGVLELFWTGNLTAFFVRAKTSRHFSGAPVYISFRFVFAIITIIICIFLIYKDKKSLFSKRKHAIQS